MRNSVFSRMPQATAACLGPSCFESSVATRVNASVMSEVTSGSSSSLLSAYPAILSVISFSASSSWVPSASSIV